MESDGAAQLSALRTGFRLTMPQTGRCEDRPPIKSNLGLLAHGWEHEGLEAVAAEAKPDERRRLERLVEPKRRHGRTAIGGEGA